MLKYILLSLFLLSCSHQELIDKNVDNTNMTGKITETKIVEDVSNEIITTKYTNISGIPYWLKSIGIDDFKLIGAKKELSYDRTENNKKMMSLLIINQDKNEINREVDRFIRENNVKKETYIKQDLEKKINNDIKILGLKQDKQILSKILDDKTNSFYKKSITKNGFTYDMYLWVGGNYILFDAVEYVKEEVKTKNKYAFVQENDEVGCVKLELQDDKSNKVELPKEIVETNLCDSIHIISPNNKFIFFNILNIPQKHTDYMIYNLETKKVYNLGEEDMTIDGMTCIWNDNNSKVACALVDQDEYEAMTKLVILTIDNKGSFLTRQDIQQKKGETMNFDCGSVCDVLDFKFVGDNEIHYKGHNLINAEKNFIVNVK